LLNKNKIREIISRVYYLKLHDDLLPKKNEFHFILDQLVFMFQLLIIVCSIFYHSSRITAFNENMAWRSSGGSHRELIENLYRNGLIKDQRIKEVMLQIDRADFTDRKSDAYDDRPQSSNVFKLTY
jgi:hypothetical protein